MGYLLPRMLIACFVVDALFRFAPSGWRPMDVGEAEVRHRMSGEAYVRNLRVQTPAAYGDLARIGNLQELREYRSHAFTTDELGFRNGHRTRPPVAVVFGDSFAQSGSDGDNLADQLGRVSGCDIFNAAGPDARFRQPDLALLQTLAVRIPLQSGFVISERLERVFFDKPKSEPTSIGAAAGEGLEWGAKRVPGAWRLRKMVETIREMAGSSPLEVLSERPFRMLRNDKILPNSYAENVVKATLRNGDWILFHPDELATYEQRWPVDVSYWTKIAPDLGKLGLRLVVILAPNKYTVYSPLLADPMSVSVEPGELLKRAEAKLRSAGITVVNLTQVLRATAAKDLDRHEYVYWRDDTHWNSRGVAIAAAEIDRVVPEIRQLCRRAS